MPGENEDIDNACTPFAGFEAEAAEAEACIGKGDYHEALKRYRDLRVRMPGNRHLLQRTAELKGFLNMLGRGDNALMERLGKFLNALKKGSEEFFRSPV